MKKKPQMKKKTQMKKKLRGKTTNEEKKLKNYMKKNHK